MSEGGHHHGGDTGGQPGFSDPGFQPGMFPPPESRQQAPGPFGSMPPAYGRRRYGMRRYRPRAGSPAWVALWIVRLAVLGFIAFVAYQVIHGVATFGTPSGP